MRIVERQKIFTRFSSSRVDKSLNDYMRKLNEEVPMIKDYTKQSTIYTMLNEICLDGFKCNMAQKSPKTLAIMIKEDKIIQW